MCGCFCSGCSGSISIFHDVWHMEIYWLLSANKQIAIYSVIVEYYDTIYCPTQCFLWSCIILLYIQRKKNQRRCRNGVPKSTQTKKRKIHLNLYKSAWELLVTYLHTNHYSFKVAQCLASGLALQCLSCESKLILCFLYFYINVIIKLL